MRLASRYGFSGELHHIKAQNEPTANRLDADLVPTKDSYVELKQLVAAIKLEIKRVGERLFRRGQRTNWSGIF